MARVGRGTSSKDGGADPGADVWGEEQDAPGAGNRRNDTGLGQIIPPAFIRQVALRVVDVCPYRPGEMQSQIRGSLAKFWFGDDPSIHYEVWVHARTNQLEVGLHCESAAGYNRSLYTALDRCLLEIQARLGSQLWLEEWDHGWVRLYETHPLQPLDDVRVEEIAGRISELICALQPMYEEIAAELPRPPIVASEPFRGRQRRR